MRRHPLRVTSAFSNKNKHMPRERGWDWDAGWLSKILATNGGGRGAASQQHATALRSGGAAKGNAPPNPPPGSAFPPPFMHLYRLVFSKSRCLWPSLSNLFFGPFGLLYSPLKSKKSFGRGRPPPLRPTRIPTAISNPNPNPTAISAKTADFLYLCRCAPPDLRAVAWGVYKARHQGKTGGGC
jgi:hypothetical protein